jgi:hypothetical protein
MNNIHFIAKGDLLFVLPREFAGTKLYGEY